MAAISRGSVVGRRDDATTGSVAVQEGEVQLRPGMSELPLSLSLLPWGRARIREPLFLGRALAVSPKRRLLPPRAYDWGELDPGESLLRRSPPSRAARCVGVGVGFGSP